MKFNSFNMEKKQKTTKTSVWKKVLDECGWSDWTIKQRLIVIWWSISFCGFCVMGPMWLIAIIVANFALATFCLVRFVPEPKCE